jgi:hypothetical protein
MEKKNNIYIKNLFLQGNIKAVMAMGDSITAGFAMVGIPPANLVEWRQYVYSNGGAEGAYTLGNFLATYNPDIQGRATTWTIPLTKGIALNGGVSHASVQDTPAQVC